MNWTLTLYEPRKIFFRSGDLYVYLDLSAANKFKLQPLEGSYANGEQFQFLDKNSSIVSIIENDIRTANLTFYNQTGLTSFPNSIVTKEMIDALIEVGKSVLGIKGGRRKAKY